uniref:Uncharacterized protein n=1 Tax=Lepeophtheirus salmonis TaxID=72036 RepID=A0A0K2VAJ6_LEPSM
MIELKQTSIDFFNLNRFPTS